MFNLKLTMYGAIFGLIISIFFGIVGGGIQFGVMLLRAFISALLCGGILGLASFLFKRFLSDSTGDLSNLENSAPVAGGMVDIRIDEDVLPDSDNAPDFYVTRKYGENQLGEKKSLGSENLGAIKKDTVQTETPNVQNNEQNFVAAKSSTVEESNSESSPQQFVPTPLTTEKYYSSNTNASEESLSESLDSLPELGGFAPEVRTQESEVIEDSAFARGETSSVELVPDAVVGADTNLMAEAIKTLLRREG